MKFQLGAKKTKQKVEVNDKEKKDEEEKKDDKEKPELPPVSFFKLLS
jgi:hypothetical protein